MMIKFQTAQEMVVFLRKGNELYDPNTGMYLRAYKKTGILTKVLEDDMALMLWENYITCGKLWSESIKEGLIVSDLSYYNPLVFCEDLYALNWYTPSDYAIPKMLVKRTRREAC